jgi:hypothetical protein
MKKRILTVLVTVVGLLAFASAAWASPPGVTTPPGGHASGSGTLHDGGTFGFNAQEDLSGSIEYHSPDGTLTVHCNDLNGWNGYVSGNGWNDATFGSNNCSAPGQDPAYRVWVDAIDRGEGANAPQDKVHIRVYTWPGKVLLFEEVGTIENGNVQVILH